MLAGIKNGMRNALNMHREKIATCQLTRLQATMFHSHISRATAILYTRRECSIAILYTSSKCSTTIVYTYPVLEPGDAL